jgi:hypothetical protein
MNYKTILNNICKENFNKSFKDLNKSDLKQLALNLNISITKI